MIYKLIDAISHIRPSAEFSIIDNSEIIWHDTNQTQPSEQEIADAYVALAQNDENKEKNKAAAQAKLAALGLTADDLKALGL